MYQKEIIYMGLFHDQVKERNAGYLKVDKRDSLYRLELQVKNISSAITGNFPIRLQSETGWQEAAALVIKEGNGKWNGNIAKPVLRAEILLSDAMKIKGESKLAAAEEWKEKETDVSAPPVQKERRQEVLRERTVQAAAEQKEMPVGAMQPGVHREELETKTKQAEAEQTETKQTETEPETTIEPVIRAESMSGRRPDRTSAKPAIKAERISVRPEHTPLYENKWEQLLTTYEQIHPYGDNRIYVKLAPKDFIVLRENYQHLVNNSFLLHGFYNYRYLILGKEKDFYLGVPGVFYEREKMVALMFGFEAFECEGGKAEEGKFGYYLRKVEL
ncbi:MAG: hypothetical protein K2H40_07120 [Lachnospiraceae bacterium]|nr:hypothetical protein [Lachnospiraceae bacterium]